MASEHLKSGPTPLATRKMRLKTTSPSSRPRGTAQVREAGRRAGEHMGRLGPSSSAVRRCRHVGNSPAVPPNSETECPAWAGPLLLGSRVPGPEGVPSSAAVDLVSSIMLISQTSRAQLREARRLMQEAAPDPGHSAGPATEPWPGYFTVPGLGFLTSTTSQGGSNRKGR